MQADIEKFNDKKFWLKENLLYVKAGFRLRKCARIVNALAADRQCYLLDLGCGPATLRSLLDPNINYHGVDIALHEAAPDLHEMDFVENAIGFENKQFDIVVALGVFEYMGKYQRQKFDEISRILKEGGKFIMSYVNFSHFRRIIYPIYNNIQSIGDLKASLQEVFHLEKCFPVGYHWRHKEPGKFAIPGIQMHLNWNIPLLHSWLAVQYFFICSKRS